jgi:hypothetical protein
MDQARLRLEMMQEIASIRAALASWAETGAERDAAIGGALGRLDILLGSLDGPEFGSFLTADNGEDEEAGFRTYG